MCFIPKIIDDDDRRIIKSFNRADRRVMFPPSEIDRQNGSLTRFLLMDKGGGGGRRRPEYFSGARERGLHTKTRRWRNRLHSGLWRPGEIFQGAGVPFLPPPSV